MSTNAEKTLRIEELLEAESRYIQRIRELEKLLGYVAGYTSLNDTPETRHIGRTLFQAGIYPAMALQQE